MSKRKIISMEEMVKALKILIGTGNIYSSGRARSYEVGDVMLHQDNNSYTLYRCLVSGSYSLPTIGNDIPKFKKINLRGR